MRGRTPRTLTLLLPIVLAASLESPAYAQDRIFVDQYTPLRSELMIADADGSSPHKLLPGA